MTGSSSVVASKKKEAAVSSPAAAATPLTTPVPAASAAVDVSSLPANLLKSAVVVTVGCVQGLLLGLAGMFSPYTFRSQMYFETFILMKIFISGLGSSMIVQSLLFDTMLPEKWNVVRSYRRVSMGYTRVALGCLLIGAGMAICGSGPTMIGVQLGMGMGSALYIFAGFLAGAMLFQLLEPIFGFPLICWKGDEEKTVLEDFLNDAVTVNRDGQLTAAGRAGKSAKTGRPFYRYRDIALPVGVLMVAAAAGLEMVFPHAEDMRKVGLGGVYLSPSSPFSYVLPSLAGGFIGINQISTRLISSDGQGGSRSLVNIVATITNGAVGSRFKLDAFAKAWQVLHVYGGTLLGGYVALQLMNRFLFEQQNQKQQTDFAAVTAAIGFSPIVSFVGAAIVGFGGRFAGGCTCGHGISGASELCVQSLVGAGAIFGGGIATALLLGLRIPEFSE